MKRGRKISRSPSTVFPVNQCLLRPVWRDADGHAELRDGGPRVRRIHPSVSTENQTAETAVTVEAVPEAGAQADGDGETGPNGDPGPEPPTEPEQPEPPEEPEPEQPEEPESPEPEQPETPELGPDGDSEPAVEGNEPGDESPQETETNTGPARRPMAVQLRRLIEERPQPPMVERLRRLTEERPKTNQLKPKTRLPKPNSHRSTPDRSPVGFTRGTSDGRNRGCDSAIGRSVLMTGRFAERDTEALLEEVHDLRFLCLEVSSASSPGGRCGGRGWRKTAA